MSTNNELIAESSSFNITLLCYSDDKPPEAGHGPSWLAGIMTARQPVNCNDTSGPGGFNGTPGLSIFMYNPDGQQARAFVQLDPDKLRATGPAPAPEAPDAAEVARLDLVVRMEGQMKADAAGQSTYPKTLLDGRMVVQSENDVGTLAPSKNFVYYFEKYDYFASSGWEVALHTGADGSLKGGSFDAFAAATAAGSRVKLGVRRLAADLAAPGSPCCDHEIIVECGWCFYYNESKKLSAATQPLVRVAPESADGPVLYRSGRWDLGWLFAESTGACMYRRLDPYTMAWEERKGSYEMRWFVQRG